MKPLRSILIISGLIILLTLSTHCANGKETLQSKETEDIMPETPPPPIRNFPERIQYLGGGGGVESVCGLDSNEEFPIGTPIPRIEIKRNHVICIYGAPIEDKNSPISINVTLSHPQYEENATFLLVHEGDQTVIYLDGILIPNQLLFSWFTSYYAGIHKGKSGDTNIFELSIYFHPIFPEGNWSVSIEWLDQKFNGIISNHPNHLINSRPNQYSNIFHQIRKSYHKNEEVFLNGAGFEPEKWYSFGIYLRDDDEADRIIPPVQIRANEEGRLEKKIRIDDAFIDGQYYIVSDISNGIRFGTPGFTVVSDSENIHPENQTNQDKVVDKPNNSVQNNVLIVFDKNSAHVINISKETISLEGVVFRRISSSGSVTAEFEAKYWGHEYAMGPINAIPPENCVTIHILEKFQKSSECKNSYSWLQRSENNPQNHFWLPQNDSNTFHVWQFDRLIHTCDIPTGSCEFYLPQP